MTDEEILAALAVDSASTWVYTSVEAFQADARKHAIPCGTFVSVAGWRYKVMDYDSSPERHVGGITLRW